MDLRGKGFQSRGIGVRGRQGLEGLFEGLRGRG